METALAFADRTEVGAELAPVDETPRFLAARQAYLDALPIAAAVVAAGSRGIRVNARNTAFAKLDRKDAPRRAALLTRLAASKRLQRVLTGACEGDRFEWRDGGMIDGRHFIVSVSPLSPSPTNGARALLTLVDRTIEVQTERSLRRQILIDPLTGLPNRTGFVDGLELRIADDGSDQLAVALVDLSRFSRVNECMGTLGGDELIVTVARRLTTTLRGHDLLARTGANEFAIVVRLTEGPGDVLHVARRIEAALAQPFRLSDFEIKLDCAIGCALATGTGDGAEELICHAQLALKTAKTSKRIEMYQPSAMSAAHRRFTLETELRRAIERDELTLAFQPLIALASGKIAGFEALARWRHPEQGEIHPSEFVPVAEDSGLIMPLGRWALDSALRTLAAWDAEAGRTLPLYIGVNMSPIQIARDDVAQTVAAALRNHRLAGHRLSVELTESALIVDPVRAGRTLEALKACDAMVAMDDFGTGFSNLASLQRLPIDTLKIDRSFVTDMLDDPDKVAIVRAVLGLAHALGMTTTAEGIETPELARTLAALGCTTGQGFTFAPALAPAAALAFALESLGSCEPRKKGSSARPSGSGAAW